MNLIRYPVPGRTADYGQPQIFTALTTSGITTGDMSSDGLGDAQAVGASIASGAASSDGIGTAIAVGADNAVPAAASSDGMGDAQASGASIVSGAASSAGSAIARMVGADGSASTIDVTVWGKKAKKRRQILEDEDAALVMLVNQIAPKLFEGRL